MRLLRFSPQFSFVLLIALLCVAVTSATPAHAQDNRTTIILSVSSFQEDFYKNTVIPQFEAANPDLHVYLKTTDSFGSPLNASQDIADYLDDAAEYLASADVVAIDNDGMTPELTRSGYVLDLAPLVNSDSSFDTADFYQAILRSFQWDNGLWALPTSVEAQTLTYDTAAFDAAGLAYPDENWTLVDFDYAVRALTKYNADGSVASPGMMEIGGNLQALMIAFLGQTVANDSVVPSIPDYSSADLENLLTIWSDLVADGAIGMPTGGEFNTPLMFGSSNLAGGRFNNVDSDTSQITLLPGGRVAVNASGYAISGGTQYPEVAYRFVKYLTSSAEVSTGFFNGITARKSLANSTSNNNGGGGPGGNGGGGPGGEFADQIQNTNALILPTLDNAINGSDLRFSQNLTTAVDNMANNGVDARTALNEIESALLTRLATADERRSTPIIVAAPPSVPQLAANEVALKFAATASMMPFPNEEAWIAAAEAFAAQDAEVGYVEIETTFPGSLEEMTTEYECFYLPSNEVSGGDLSLLRSLDPLMSADVSFSASNIVGNLLSQVQVDNQTWAYPLTVEPVTLRYNRSLFEQAGAVAPTSGTWTVQEFEDALRTLKSNGDGETAPFMPGGFGSTYLMALIAAYGGLPFDYRTTPYTVNFTDPATVEAIRQVLDLAKDGLIEYQALFDTGGGLAFAAVGENAVYVDLGGFGGGRVFIFAGPGGGDAPFEVDPMVTFPRGTTYTPIGFDLGAGYISASTQHAEACYRFLSFIATRADLFTSMPASRAMLSNPNFTATQDAETLAYYQSVDETLTLPNAVVIPSVSPFGGRGGTPDFSSQWLNRAFDRYVLEDAVLETELADAETYTKAYQECIVGADSLEQNTPEYFQFFGNCMAQVDPTMTSF